MSLHALARLAVPLKESTTVSWLQASRALVSNTGSAAAAPSLRVHLHACEQQAPAHGRPDPVELGACLAPQRPLLQSQPCHTTRREASNSTQAVPTAADDLLVCGGHVRHASGQLRLVAQHMCSCVHRRKGAYPRRACSG